MDIKPSEQTQSISDDQELAKVLAGISDDTATDDSTASAPDPAVVIPPMPDPIDTATTETEITPPPLVAPAELPEPVALPPLPPTSAAPSGDLDSIKQQALGELRPLVDKLNVAPEEKFDTYLLLLRSTDDRDLIGPAHEAAVAITDEARKAQALLDVIKEIDYLNQKQAV